MRWARKFFGIYGNYTALADGIHNVRHEKRAAAKQSPGLDNYVRPCLVNHFLQHHQVTRIFADRNTKPMRILPNAQTLRVVQVMEFINDLFLFDARQHLMRSEERRVGKEGRSRWSPYH